MKKSRKKWIRHPVWIAWKILLRYGEYEMWRRCERFLKVYNLEMLHREVCKLKPLLDYVFSELYNEFLLCYTYDIWQTCMPECETYTLVSPGVLYIAHRNVVVLGYEKDLAKLARKIVKYAELRERDIDGIWR